MLLISKNLCKNASAVVILWYNAIRSLCKSDSKKIVLFLILVMCKSLLPWELWLFSFGFIYKKETISKNCLEEMKSQRILMGEVQDSCAYLTNHLAHLLFRWAAIIVSEGSLSSSPLQLWGKNRSLNTFASIVEDCHLIITTKPQSHMNTNMMVCQYFSEVE